MDSEYNVGTGSKTVTIEINIKPQKNGVLVTPEAKLFPLTKPQPKQVHSDDYYFEYEIGERDQIKETMITIELVFDLKNLTSNERKDFFDKLEIDYALSGGLSNQTFKHEKYDIKKASSDGKIIITRKDIFLN